MRRGRLIRLMVLLVMAVATVGVEVSPAAANHEPPHDGPNHVYGEMVDYPLTFPVQGSYWYEDWFWAARGDGVHHAQDIMAEKMTPVVAAASGTVTWINWSQDPNDLNPERCCNLVITHDDGWESWYIHLNNDTPGTDDGLAWGIAPGIELGVHVDAGQLIGWAGDSANAEDTPSHLHFELYDQDRTLVNPYDSLRRAEGGAVCSVARFPEIGDLAAGQGVLKRGSAGSAVTQLQAALLALGFDPQGVDGVFGPRTESAVIGYQTAHGLTVDGIVGSQTRGNLALLRDVMSHGAVLDPDGRDLSMGALGEDVKDLQVLLAVAQFDPGPADGVFGRLSEGAVKAYQSEVGLASDGVVGPDTRVALARSLGVAALVSCSG